MQRLLASYLLKNRNCPLPGIGSLQMFLEDARYLQADKTMLPPKMSIGLFNQELDEAPLVEFISFKANIPLPTAEKSLSVFCKKLRRLKRSDEPVYLPHAGRFIGGNFGKIEFVQDAFAEQFFQPLIAEPVIRQNVNHEMLVGDKETDSATMEEFFKPAEPIAKENWWIAALVIGLIAAAAIAFYFFGGKINNNIVPQPAPQTYTTG